MAAFAAHTSLKHVVVVDEDINIFDPADVEFAVATRVKGDMDILIIPNVRGSLLIPEEHRMGRQPKWELMRQRFLSKKRTLKGQ